MSEFDEVLERLVTDAAFAHELSRDTTKALAGYELSGEDLATLSTQVSFDRGEGALVEERISKSSTFGLLSTMAGGLSGLGGDTTGLGGPDTTPAGVGVENPTTIGDPNEAPGVIDPNQAPGGALGYGLAVDAFTPADVEEGPEELGTAPAGIIILDQPDPGIGNPNEAPSIVDPNQAPAQDVGYHEVDWKPTESVGWHEVDEQPAPDVGIHETDQPAPQIGLVDPGDRVGFNPQPDPPGLPG
jgi:hypothetical protein